ncbi:DUF6402 family protein [Herbaspirillum huttiense]|uniref:DUF6402 family protein n=1 Tax=Herbaspirillum huttiense TaxID=863372 RepID=UPI002176D68B|nr:DUF6402 family protein [Herbaspirillum huttiense]UWE18476.1 DUF6402 family protein [Herbaspirillum huttiense]
MAKTKARRLPYYTIEKKLFGGSQWKKHLGAVAINTPQKISFDRPAPGTAPTKEINPPKPSREQARQQKLEAARQLKLVEQAQKQKRQESRQAQLSEPGPKILDAEDHEKIPEFDLQDLPEAMDKMGWPVAAHLARKWFAGPSHVFNNKPDSEQPWDDKIVTLQWALRNEGVQAKLRELLVDDIYSDKAVALLKNKILRQVSDEFRTTKSARPASSFIARIINSDIRQFHLDWQFQRRKVNTFHGSSWLTPTEVTAALGNFALYAAVGRFEIQGERYFNYKKAPYEYCMDAQAILTHVYIYIKDNYSFNDDDPSKSQYLGHWNKGGMVTSYIMNTNEFLGLVNSQWKTTIKADNEERLHIDWDYLSFGDENKYPIDTRSSFWKKLLKEDVYWPVYNSSFNEWRKKKERGQDFMIYSQPELYALNKPITLRLGTICRPHENTLSGQ